MFTYFPLFHALLTFLFGYEKRQNSKAYAALFNFEQFLWLGGNYAGNYGGIVNQMA